MGLRSYYIIPAQGLLQCQKAQLSQLKLKFPAESPAFNCPSPYQCSKLEANATTEIKNKHHTLTFDVNLGLLTSLRYHKDGLQTDLGEEIGVYSSKGSGAYLFKPDGEAQPAVRPGGTLLVSEGDILQEVHAQPRTLWQRSPISHTTRIYNGKDTVQEFMVEKEYHVELTKSEFNDREIIARFKTSLNNNRVFFSDLNGFQTVRRETYDKIPLQGNYYPMPSFAFLQDDFHATRFSVHSRQSLGVASLKNGWLEIMLDRRLVRDDGRGLGQGVMDNRPVNVVFHFLVEKNVSFLTELPSPAPSLLSHRLSAQLNYPLHAFLGKPQEVSVLGKPLKSFSPLSAPFPCDLHVVNFKIPRPEMFFESSASKDPRFVLILQRRGWDPAFCNKGHSQCKVLAHTSVDIFSLFKHFKPFIVKACSLNILHEHPGEFGYIQKSHRKDLTDVEQLGLISIPPMELQAFKIDFRSEN
eukprot:TRINITY_DN2252_c0_g1_i1.p1 TRINITY_DN2252_c0_g1~~TRINITY_DN2252_c0_g1_i1.p1  ORF type:complete len:525 (+),score=82.78 TRINITY_DN2252_c0_g1_i1:173-1576(+)